MKKLHLPIAGNLRSNWLGKTKSKHSFTWFKLDSGYGSSLEISVDESMFSGYPSEVDSNPVEGNHKLCR